MKKIYLYLPDGTFSTTAEISDDAPLPPLSTAEPVPQGLKKPIWQEGSWKEGWKDTQPSYTDILKPLPTSTQKLIMQQSQQIALLQNTMMSQDQANVKLQATNQQQEKQIEQLQQLLMQANQQQAVADKKGEN